MDVIYITDEKYAMPTCVSIVSLMENAYSPELKIFVLADNVSNESECCIVEASNGLATIIEIDTEKYQSLITDISDFTYVSPTAMAKFELPMLFPDLNRALYLDCDIIVQKELVSLYNQDLSGYYAAAVEDMGDQCDSEGFSIDAARIGIKQRRYFNSGVLLLNLDKMRQEKVPDKLLEYRRNGKNYFVDQDALNYVCANKWKELPLRYNFRSALFDTMSMEEINERFYVDGYKTIESCIEDQTVLHISNRMKPWRYYLPWFSELFLKYYNLSPYKNKRIHLLSPIKATYDECKENESYMEWRFPYDRIKKGAKVILYGGGNVGTSLFAQNSKTEYCRIVAWVDKKKHLQDDRFVAPDKIKGYVFDYLIIAVHDRIYASEIKKEMESYDIPKHKIICFV